MGLFHMARGNFKSKKLKGAGRPTKNKEKVIILARRKKHKGRSWITTRKIGGHRRRVKVTKIKKGKYRVRVIGKKRRRRR